MSIEAHKIGGAIYLDPFPLHIDNNTYLSLYHCKAYFVFASYLVDKTHSCQKKIHGTVKTPYLVHACC